MEGQQPAAQPDAPIDTSPIMQTNETNAKFYEYILMMPTLPDLQHAQMVPPQNPSLVVNPPLIACHTSTRTCTAFSSYTHTHTHTHTL